MNKFALLLIIAALGTVIYFKTTESNRHVTANNGNSAAKDKTSAEEAGAALPEEAKNLISEIQSSSNNENPLPEDIVLFEKEQAERDKKAMEEVEEQRKIAEYAYIEPSPDIPSEIGPIGYSLKWPCKTASFADIIDSYSRVWGTSSPKPHDTKWYSDIYTGISNYAICRAFKTNNASVCNVLGLMKGDGINGLRESDCEFLYAQMQVFLYVLGRVSKTDCETFKAQPPKSSLCDEVKKNRGAALCNSLGLASGAKEWKDCVSAFPATLEECSSLGAELSQICSDSFKLFNALKSENPELCPAGSRGLACKSYLYRKDSSINYCQPFMDKLSRSFCSGGKYSATRKISLN